MAEVEAHMGSEEHPIVVVVGCRSTVLSAQSISVAGDVPRLLAFGVVRVRVELLRESAEPAEELIRG